NGRSIIPSGSSTDSFRRRGENMKDPGVNPIGGVPGETSLTLLEKVRRQDQDAWHRLVALYTPLVYHWCKSAGLQKSDAEDVGQQVFLAVSGAVGRFHRDQPGDSFRGWLRTITRRKIRDHGRRASGRAVGGGDAYDQMLLVAAEPE